jgi:hypothetical protein
MKMQNDSYMRALLVCVAAFLIALTGCKSSRRLTAPSPQVTAAKEAGDLFLALNANSFQYHTLSARTKAELTLGAKELSSRLDIKMIKDSIFSLSILPLLGIEAVRVEFLKDSVKVIDRMNKIYAVESYDVLRGGAGIDFNLHSLQALFTNHVFLPGGKEDGDPQDGRFTLKREGALTEISVKDAMKMIYAFKSDNEEKLLSTEVTGPGGGYSIQWTYDDFRKADGQSFPMQMEGKVISEGMTMGEVRLYFTRLQNDIPLDTSSSFTGKYRRTAFSDIIKGIQKM